MAINAATGPWQQKLQDQCHAHGWGAPEYSLASDRRGGRTAWSSSVQVAGRSFPARFWYDGANVNNAMEDAAEKALQELGLVQSPQPQSPPQQQAQAWRYSAVIQ